MAKQTLEDQARGTEPTAAEVRAALDRILRSRCFEHAARASDFLRFVVGKTLAGEGNQLKGYSIAIHVFGRSADFDAKSDPLVRVEALRLRQRLTEYYAGEGAEERVRLELPRGGYALKASFTSPQPQRVEAAAPAPTQRNAVAQLWSRVRVAAVAAAALLVSVSTVPQRQTRAVDPPPAASTPARAHRTQITVVPLENIGTGARFDRLAAALTEEIMLRLDGLDLYVIATQAKSYRSGKMLDGVLHAEHSYVLTGSVRDQADGARITLRIIEAETRAQIWTQAYDEPPGIEEQPELQSKIARDAAAAAALFGPVFDAELALARRSTQSLELPDCQTRYRAFRRATDPALFPEAFACFEGLVARQPQLGHAWAGLAMLYIDEHVYYSGAGDRGAALARARAAVHRALELDATNVLANVALTRYQYYDGDPEFARTAERTIALDPDNPEMLGLLGILLTAHGESARGLELVARAIELSPQRRGLFNLAHVFADLQDGKPCDALLQAQGMEANKWFIAHMVTAAAAGLCGDEAAAAEARSRLLAAIPSFEAEAVGLVDLWRFNPPLREAVLNGLQAAGLEVQPRDATVLRDRSADASHER
jgi:TolB-like protein